jgi:hypothetical protein
VQKAIEIEVSNGGDSLNLPPNRAARCRRSTGGLA